MGEIRKRSRKEQNNKQARENVECSKARIKPNYSLDLSRDVHVRTFYFGFIG